MSDDVATALHEIAGLLKQQVDHAAAMSKRAEERFASFPKPDMPDFSKVNSVLESEAKASREEGQRQRAEDNVFRDRLVGLLQEQNELLTHLIAHLAQGGRRGSGTSKNTASPKSKARARKRRPSR